MTEQVIGVARIDIEGNADGVEAAVARAKTTITDMSQSAQAQYQQLSKAERRRIDTLIRQTDTVGRTREEQIAYNAALRANGPLLDEIVGRLQKNKQALVDQNRELSLGGLSAKEYAFAMRGVPAQITDIVVSLQGGQRPFTVMMQQGGQLKDMFGGIIPAARALGSTFLGMINPATLSAASIAALSVAVYQGSKEMVEFERNSIMTGDTLGITSSRVSDMAARLDQLDGVTRGGAAKALTDLAKTGKISADQLETVATVALESNRLLGKEIADTVEEFVKLGDEPSKAVAELNEKYNFLTLAVYEQIKALEEQGRTEEAAKLAQSEYAQASVDRLERVQGTLGYLERAWASLKSVISETWDEMKGLGRDRTELELIAAHEAQIKRYIIGVESFKGAWAEMSLLDIDGIKGLSTSDRNALEESLKQLISARASLNELRSSQAAADFTAWSNGINAEEQKAAIKAMDSVNKILDDIAPKAEKAKKAIAEYHRDLDKIRKVNPDHELLTPESIKRAEAAINKRFEERAKATKGYQNDAATRLLLTYQQTEASLRAQLESTEKLSEHQKRLVEFEQQIASLKEKSKLTKEEQSILAKESQLREQLKLNAELEAERLARDAIVKIQERSKQITEQMEQARVNTMIQQQRDISAFGFGDKAQERLESERAIYREFERYQRQLANSTDFSKNGAEERYRFETLKIQDELRRRLAMQASYYEEVDRLQLDFRLGAQHGLANYFDESQNLYLGMANLAAQSFKSMEDALANFVSRGKLDFKGLADSIIQDMIRITIQQSVTGPLAGMLGSVISGAAGSFGAPDTSYAPAHGFSSGGYTGDGGKYEPAGIVHKGEGVLSAAEIRAIGGEAGFNALRNSIMGKGHSSGGIVGSAATFAPFQAKLPANQINITVNVTEGGTSVRQQGQSGMGESLAREIAQFVDRRIQEKNIQAQRQGGMAWQARNGGFG